MSLPFLAAVNRNLESAMVPGYPFVPCHLDASSQIPVLSVLDLKLEYVKTMSFQYLVNRPGTQLHSQSL